MQKVLFTADTTVNKAYADQVSLKDLDMVKVRVYRNLHNGLWSIKIMEGTLKGRVVAHAEKVMLLNASQKVYEAGRQRVIKEKAKNVHAFIEGQMIIDADLFNRVKLTRTNKKSISYNPYYKPYFYLKDGFVQLPEKLGRYVLADQYGKVWILDK